MPRLSRADGHPPVVIEAAPAYEFVMSLVIVSEVANHDVAEIGRPWLTSVQQRAGKALMSRLAAFTQESGDQFIHLLPLAYDAPPPRTVPALLEHLAGLDGAQLVLQMAGYNEYHMRRTTPPEVMRAAVEGDTAAAAEFVRSCEGWPQWHAFISHLLEQDPEAVKRDLLHIVVEWYERVWKSEEPQLLPILERDAEAKRLLIRELSFERFVEVATNGVQFVPRPGIERLVLIPSFVSRPWVSHAEQHGAIIMAYPVADESVVAERDAPPLRLLRLTKALGDEKRLRILRALAAGPRSLVDLAEQFEIPKTTMHHHMVTLRSAGLVTVGAGSKEYRLRGDALPNLAQMLSGYLGTNADGTEPALSPAAQHARPAPASSASSGRPERSGRRRPRPLASPAPTGERARRER